MELDKQLNTIQSKQREVEESKRINTLRES